MIGDHAERWLQRGVKELWLDPQPVDPVIRDVPRGTYFHTGLALRPPRSIEAGATSCAIRRAARSSNRFARARALGELLRVSHCRDVVLHVLVRPAARMSDKRELRKDEAELGEEAEHLAGHHLDVVLAADDDEARSFVANEDAVGNRDLVLDAVHPLGHLEIE